MAEPKFKCPRCGSGMNQKCILKTHICKKKLCQANIEDMNREELMEYYNTLGQKKTTPFQCNGCHKFYSNKRSLTIHIDSFCTHTKKDDTVKTLLNQLKEEIKELKAQLVPQNIINIENIANTNNIILNCFSTPNMDHLEKGFLTDCILNQDLPTVIENVYYRKEYPENRSIYLDDKGSYFLFEDGKWEKNNDVINELFDQGFRFLSCHRRENRFEVEPLLNFDTKNWFDAIIDEDQEITDPIKKYIKMSLSNNKSILKQKVK